MDGKKLSSVADDGHADDLYLLLPLLKQTGVSAAMRHALADWYADMWPQRDWQNRL